MNFKYSVSWIRYGDLLHIWNYIKEIFLSQTGLRKILGKRQRLLDHLSKKNRVRYKKLIGQLGILV